MTSDLHPDLTFEAFVVGASNQLAVTAARTASENPGSLYNPLFIYSQAGLGKTHLLMAMGHHARALAPDLSVEYWTLHEFVEAFHHAVSAGDVGAFRRRLESTDVVLLDDVQFISHSKELQAELLRLAAELKRVEKQLVLTSDRPLAEISDLDDRLLEQLGGGLVVNIGIPEFETRLAILQRRAQSGGSQLSAEVLTVLAEIDVQHVRALLGMLSRLNAFQSINETQLTPAEARAVVMGEQMEASAPEPASPPPQESAAGAGDEFGEFLSGLAATVTEQVDGWRDSIRGAIEEWSARGYNTERLEALVGEGIPGGTAAAVRAYEAVIERLRAIEAEVATMDPDTARDPVFKTPDGLDAAEELLKQTRANFVPPPGPSDVYSLDQFVTGEPTKMALEAGRTVVEQPGARYNPLMIVGPSGVGKTHLLHAIGRALCDRSGRTVACLSAETFVDDLVAAIEHRAVPGWRARYRYASAFLLDDVQKIAARKESQEELFQLFNLFADAHRQMVFTSNVQPQDIEGLDDRLASRLVSGLVATISPPDAELRRTILTSRLAREGETADAALIDYLVDRDTDSVRSLLSMVQRVTGGAEAMGAAMTVQVARELLEPEGPRHTRPSLKMRTSGVFVPPRGIQSREKFVWEWPDPMERIMDELT